MSKISLGDVLNGSVNKIINETYEELIKDKAFVSEEVIEDALSVDVVKVDEKEIQIAYDFEKYPDIKLNDYKNMSIKYTKPLISKEDVEKEIDHMIQKDIMLVPKDNASIIKGDMVNFDFEGFIDDKPFAGGKAEGHELEIGSNMFIPGFEEQMIGLKNGDKKDICVTFPKDYHAKDMAGKNAVFKLKINSIKTIKKPELDDSYIARFNIPDVKTKIELHKYLEKNIFDHKNYQARQDAIKQISENIILNSKLPFVPKSLLKSEMERLNEDTKKRADQAKVSVDEYIKKHLGFKNQSNYDKQVEEMAKKNLVLVIAIEKIIEESKIEISDSEFESHLAKMAKMYNLKVEEIKQRMNNNFDGVKTFLLQEKVFDHLIEINSKKE
jgi:trigger factor